MSEAPATPPPESPPTTLPSDDAVYACQKCGCTSFIVSRLHTFTRAALDAVERTPGFAAFTTRHPPVVVSCEYQVYCANCRLTAIHPKVQVT